MTSVRAIDNSTAVFKGEDGFKTYKTLKIKGDANKDDAPIEIKFGGHIYSRLEIEKNGKKEIMYVCTDEEPEVVEGKEAEKYTTEKACEDGKDDGEISWGEKLWSMGKGIVKPFKSMFNFSNTKETWKSIGKIGLAVGIGALSIAFPVVGLVLAGVGAVIGGATLTKGIVDANRSKKDADTKAAYENIGNGAFTMITSLLGFKAMRNSIATKASAIDSANAASATATATAGAAKINQIGQVTNSTTIKTGILANTVTKAKNAVTAVKPQINPTLKTLKGIKTYNTKGLGLAKLSCDTNITAEQLPSLTNINAINDCVREASQALNTKDITAAYTAAQKLKTIIPYLDDAVVQANPDVIKNAVQLTQAISAIPKVTASVKGTTAVIAANGSGVENMFTKPETQKIQAYDFAS